MSERSAISTHVLDTAAGRPAAGIPVRLERVADPSVLGQGSTDADGRVGDIGPTELESGSYRLVFDTGDYFAGDNTATFFPEVAVTFAVSIGIHYHLPLLLSPFAYSTYRGS